MSTPPREIAPEHLPYGVRVVGAWSWRIVVAAVAGAMIVWALRGLSPVVVPLAVATLLSVLLHPVVDTLERRTPLNRVAASLVAVLGLIVVVIGLLSLAGSQLASGISGMTSSVGTGLDQIQTWLASGPLHLSGAQLSQYLEKARAALSTNSTKLTSGVMSVGSSAVDFAAGTLIALVASFFFLLHGKMIWTYFLRWLPLAARQPTYQASRRGWVSLGSYARTQVIVAAVDAAGIALGALVLGLPFVVPILVVVFVASFVPIVGAIVSGAVAVLVALVVKGPVVALVMLGIVLLVQQIEAHGLQPFLMGHAVALHPLSVIIAVAAGSFLLGIVGALFAVPVLAAVNSAGRYLAHDDPFPQLGDDVEPQLLPRRRREADGSGGAQPGDDTPRGAARLTKRAPKKGGGATRRD